LNELQRTPKELFDVSVANIFLSLGKYFGDLKKGLGK